VGGEAEGNCFGEEGGEYVLTWEWSVKRTERFVAEDDYALDDEVYGEDEDESDDGTDDFDDSRGGEAAVVVVVTAAVDTVVVVDVVVAAKEAGTESAAYSDGEEEEDDEERSPSEVSEGVFLSTEVRGTGGRATLTCTVVTTGTGGGLRANGDRDGGNITSRRWYSWWLR